MQKRTLKIFDKYGFHYEVPVQYHLDKGFATAYYKDTIIASRDCQKLRQPNSDNDAEWEAYEESVEDLICEIDIDLSLACTGYFNSQNFN